MEDVERPDIDIQPEGVGGNSIVTGETWRDPFRSQNP